MKFIPFSKKYKFDKNVLIEDFPQYMRMPIATWVVELLKSKNLTHRNTWNSQQMLNQDFINALQIQMHEVFPTNLETFINFIFEDVERACNFLAICLQNYAKRSHASKLELILSTGGSAYEVRPTDHNASEYSEGIYDLIKRVSDTVKESSSAALQKNNLLDNAWSLCYSRNPDYEKVVSKSCDFLEGFLRDVYFKNDKKPQLKKFIHQFQDNPEILKYKGDSIVTPKSLLTDLLVKASDIRGQHTAGQGRTPTKEEAEYVLHSTIFIWNLHN